MSALEIVEYRSGRDKTAISEFPLALFMSELRNPHAWSFKGVGIDKSSFISGHYFTALNSSMVFL